MEIGISFLAKTQYTCDDEGPYFWINVDQHK